MRILFIAVAIGWALVAPCALAGQSEASDVHVRNNCRLAGQVLRTGQPNPHWDWALGYIRRCEESGPEALVVAWTARPPRDRNDLILLGATLRYFPQDHVVRAVQSTAENETATTDARIIAIGLSVEFFDPTALIDGNDLFNPRPDRVAGLLSVSDAPSLPTVKDVAGTQRDVIAMLRRIRDRTADPLVRNAARRYLVLVEN